VGPEQIINQCGGVDAGLAFEFGRQGLSSPVWKYPDQRGEDPATYASRKEKEFVPADFSVNEAVACNQVAVNWTHGYPAQIRSETSPILVVHGPMTAWNCRNGYNGYYDDFAVKLVRWRMHSDPTLTGTDNAAITFGGNYCARIEADDCEITGPVAGVFHRPRGHGSRMILRRTRIFAKTGVAGQVLQQEPDFGSVVLTLDGCTIGPRRFDETHWAIDLGGATPKGKHVAPLIPNRVFVRNYGGNSSVNFDAYWKCQAPDVVILAARNVPAEYVGLTNQAAFARFGRSLLGEIAPATTRSDVNGFVRTHYNLQGTVVNAIQQPAAAVDAAEEWLLEADTSAIENAIDSALNPGEPRRRRQTPGRE
jgi:hypothetical protein